MAITDHHDLVFFDYIRAAAETERDATGADFSADERLVVFPGLELTLEVPARRSWCWTLTFPRSGCRQSWIYLRSSPRIPRMRSTVSPRSSRFKTWPSCTSAWTSLPGSGALCDLPERD